MQRHPKGIDRECLDLVEWILRATGIDRTLVPVPIREIARRLAVPLREGALPYGVRGMCDVRRRIIVLNGRMPETRKRFVIAHELGELIVLPVSPDHGSWLNEFAGHLLVHPANLQLAAAAMRRTDRLARHFDVGESVLLYQLRRMMEEGGFGSWLR